MPPPEHGDDVSTLLQSRVELSAMPDATFAVSVEAGPDTGTRFVVDGSRPTVLVGKSPVCDVRLTDPSVSRRHAELEIVGANLRVRDLRSTNGTRVDRLRVVEAELEGGETLHVGGTALRVERLVDKPKTTLSFDGSFGRVIGASREMRRLYPLFAKLAASTIPVIIEGETGTGKEVLAESLHELGPRGSGPFIVFDCTAAPSNLVESELFGHERGAFTGATAQRKGVFEQADGGTLFIDEIGDLELSLQAKLLRAVERSEVRRVGGDRWIKVDARVLCATRRDLDHEVQAGRFRDDLLHRLAVGRAELPPLNRRKGDVPLLVDHFCKELGSDPRSLPRDLVARWADDPWPGNVRALRNAVARQLALGDVQLADADDWEEDAEPSAGVTAAAAAAPAPGDALEAVLARDLPLLQARRLVVAEFERRYIERVLAQHGGNVVHAARASGIARRYFQILRTRGRGQP